MGMGYKKGEAPKSQIDDHVFKIVNGYGDVEFNAFWRAVCGWVQKGKEPDFSKFNNPDVLYGLFDMVRDNITQGKVSYKDRGTNGANGGYKKEWNRLGLGTEEQYEHLWHDVCKQDSEKMKAEMQKLKATKAEKDLDADKQDI